MIFYLVWRPSVSSFQGPLAASSAVPSLSLPLPYGEKTYFHLFLSNLWALGKFRFVEISSSNALAQSSYVMSLGGG